MYNKGYILDENVEDIIIYPDQETNENHYIVFYKEGDKREIEGIDGIYFFTQYLNKVKGYKKKDLLNGTVLNDNTFHFCNNFEEAEKVQRELTSLQIEKRLNMRSTELENKKNRIESFFQKGKEVLKRSPLGAALIGDNPKKNSQQVSVTDKDETLSENVKESVFKKIGKKFSNFKVSHPSVYKGIIATGAVVVTASVIFVGCAKKNKAKKPTQKPVTTSTAVPTKEPQEKVPQKKAVQTAKQSLWEQALEKASTTQKNFMKKFITGSTYFNQTFAKKHEEKDVVFPDGHKEVVVRFGLSQEAYAAASILGANFSTKEYQAFMNASDISIEEYKDYYNAWFTQMFYAYAVRGGNEETGILSMVSCEEGQKVVKEIDDLHKALRTARENGNHEAQQSALNTLYQRKNEIFKIQEASSMDATYENFKKLNLPDYALLLKPIFDEVAHEYRNWTVKDNQSFYGEQDQKVFQEGGIYCHLYEWTMKENVESQAAKLGEFSSKADESYLDYDQVMFAVNKELQENNAYISYENQGKNTYKVENLRAVSATFNWTNYQEKAVDEKKSSSSSKESGKTSSTKSSTRTETTTRTEVTEETVKKSDLNAEERQEATRQEQQIQQGYYEETQKNKEEAEKQAEEKRKEDQAKEDAKKEQLEKEVQQENAQKKEEIEHMNPGPGVSNPTTDGTGAYEDFPDLNNGETSNYDEDWSDQKDTIIEGEEEYYSTASISYEMLAEQIVADLANEGIDVTVEQPVQYTKGR